MAFAFSSSGIGFFNNATVTINSATYTGGNTYLFFVGTTANAVTPTDSPTVSSGGLTLVKRGTIGTGNKRIIVYSCDVVSTTTTGITFTYAEAQLVHTYAIYLGTSIAPFVFDNVASNSGTSIDPSITMGTTKNSHIVGYFMNDKNPFAGTAESGWTEGNDGGNGFGPTGFASYYRNTTTDNTIQVTAASSTWVGLGIQYSSASRRIYIC
jgi:hypothetical protein